MKKYKFHPPYKDGKSGATTYPNTRKKAGVYLIKEGDKIVYIGYSGTDLYRTMYRHFQEWNHKGQEVVSYKNSRKRYTVRIVPCTSTQAQKLEKALIIKYKPRDNEQKYKYYKLKQGDINVVQEYEELNCILDCPF